MERWRRSKTKILKYGESIDVFIEKVNDGQEIDFGMECETLHFLSP